MFVHKLEQKEFPAQVSSLHDCTIEHLNLHPDTFNFLDKVDAAIKKRRDIWYGRPLPLDFLQG